MGCSINYIIWNYVERESILWQGLYAKKGLINTFTQKQLRMKTSSQVSLMAQLRWQGSSIGFDYASSKS